MKALLLSPGHAHFEAHLGTLQELPEVEGVLICGEKINPPWRPSNNRENVRWKALPPIWTQFWRGTMSSLLLPP